MPSMVFSLGPCIRTVNSEVVGSAPAWAVRGENEQALGKTTGRGVDEHRAWASTGRDGLAALLPSSHSLIVPKYTEHNISHFNHLQTRSLFDNTEHIYFTLRPVTLSLHVPRLSSSHPEPYLHTLKLSPLSSHFPTPFPGNRYSFSVSGFLLLWHLTQCLCFRAWHVLLCILFSRFTRVWQGFSVH